jgi:hypothetical protein
MPSRHPPVPGWAARYDSVTVQYGQLCLVRLRVRRFWEAHFLLGRLQAGQLPRPSGYGATSGARPPSPRSCTSAHLASSATSRPRAAANSATFSAAGLALGACAPTAQNLLHTWTLAPERPKPSPTSPAPRGLTRLCLPCSAWGLAPVFHGARDILSGKAVILHLKPGRRPCRLSRGALSVERDLAAQPLGEGASRLVQV